MRPLVVAVVQQGVQVGLQGLDALEQLLVHDRSEKLLEDGAVEAFGSLPSGGPRADPGDASLVLGGRALVFRCSMSPRSGFRRPQGRLLSARLRLPQGCRSVPQNSQPLSVSAAADLHEAEGVAAVGADDRVQADPADALERAHHR